MLFTTAVFAFLFLPCVVIGFFLIARRSHTVAAVWLFAASVFFYGYWMPRFTVLLLASISVNFLVGRRISRASIDASGSRRLARTWMIAGVTLNLLLLGYFKYTNFFLETLEAALGTPSHLARITLPIGISFFTFTQIAFLADTYQKGVREYKPAHYGLFVTYFPHLVAGPVLHHAQMMPQFERAETYRFRLDNFAGGCTIFCLGLLKKVVIADGIAVYADAVFNGAHRGIVPTFAEGWLGALAYTLQLYFDFSGYSDMAIGLSWMLNVRLPFNFNSPYKSFSISEFWRRWHMTLSAFLRDYLYIVLGGNRRGTVRRYVNLAVTMLLGGLWHGASWTFVFWGGLHGIYLGINHAFRAAVMRWVRPLTETRAYAAGSWLLTALAVIVAWVFFRAPTFAAAGRMLRAMTSLPVRHAGATPDSLLWNAGLDMHTGIIVCAVLAAVCVFTPNTNQIGERIRALCERSRLWRGTLCGFALTLILFVVVLNESRNSVSAFIYFNF